MSTRPAAHAHTIGEETRESIHRLTPSERRVARALLATYPIAGLESLNQLAASAGVAGPTVLRFVRKLGFGGYTDFQQALREEVQARLTSPLTLYPSQRLKPDEDVLDASLRTFTLALGKTFRSLSRGEFQSVVSLLADTRRPIYFTGGRYSQLAAHHLWEQLQMLRPNVRLIGEGFAPRVDELIDIGRRDVVCVFDYRRYQVSTVRFARRAASRRATVVLFTDPWLSPIADVASYVLTSYLDAPSPQDSMLGSFALTEALAAGVTVELGENARARLEDLEEIREGDETSESGDGDLRPRTREQSRAGRRTGTRRPSAARTSRATPRGRGTGAN